LAERLRAYQLLQASALIIHAARHAPHWAVSLAAFKDLRPGGLTEAGFAALPILTRAAAQRAGAALRSRAVPKAHGAVQEAATSGSSGTPFTVARSRLDRLMAAAPVQRGRRWNQHDLALPLLAVARMDAAHMDAGAP
jgi:phenylacetate-coenzyme A ligase PaaK-like adenylate-forming protein